MIFNIFTVGLRTELYHFTIIVSSRLEKIRRQRSQCKTRDIIISNYLLVWKRSPCTFTPIFTHTFSPMFTPYVQHLRSPPTFTHYIHPYVHPIRSPSTFTPYVHSFTPLRSLPTFTQCCSCHVTQVDGVLLGRSNRQQSPAGPVNMKRNMRRCSL